MGLSMADLDAIRRIVRQEIVNHDAAKARVDAKLDRIGWHEPHTCCNCDRVITESESNWGWCPECVAADPDWMTKPGLARLKGA